jgi:hypothetical protein
MLEMLLRLGAELGPAAVWIAVFFAAVVAVFVLYVGVVMRAILRASDPEKVKIDLPRAFRTAYLRLIYAADCCSRYSSWTCRGLRY